MSFREKSAWITFVTVLVTAGAFTAYVMLHGRHGHGALFAFLICAAGLVALQVALHIVAAALNPQDARSPKDERERAIELQSIRVGYYVLAAAALAMFFTGHMTTSVIDMIYHGFAAVTLSTLAISLSQIVLYRLAR